MQESSEDSVEIDSAAPRGPVCVRILCKAQQEDHPGSIGSGSRCGPSVQAGRHHRRVHAVQDRDQAEGPGDDGHHPETRNPVRAHPGGTSRSSRRKSASRAGSRSRWKRPQREYYLNEQIARDPERNGGEGRFQVRTRGTGKAPSSAKRLTQEASSKVRAEFQKLKLMSPMSAEATVVRNYIDWILSLPWYEQDQGQDRHRPQAATILDEDHYGLEKAQGTHPGIPGGAGPGEEDQGTHPLPGGPSGGRARLRWQNPSPGR